MEIVSVFLSARGEISGGTDSLMHVPLKAGETAQKF
jgi:hypothetical protein